MKFAFYSVVMLVLISPCTFSQTEDPSQRIRTETRYKNTLAVFNEPEIIPRANVDSEAFRLLVTATFYHPLIIRIERNGTQYVLHAKWLSGQVGYDWGTLQGQKSRRLTQKQWRTLKVLINKTSFWALASEEKDPEPNEKGEVTVCLDGTDWFLEASATDRYHVVDRYCPEADAFKAVGMFMVKLARLNIGLRLK
jgi:hypothetical protein